MKMSVKDESVESSSPKKHKKLKRKSENQNSTNNTLNHTTSTENEDVHSPAKKKTKFSAQEFRKSLKSDDQKFTAIKEFVELCERNESSIDYALQYLEAGGNCHEIATVLDSADGSVIYLCKHVFEALTILVFKIISSVPQHIASAEETCKQLLNKHLSKINVLLTSTSSKQKKSIIKFLTSVVTLSSSLAKEILLNVNFDDSVVGSLIKHQHGGEKSETVRKCFVHFLLAFLIDGNMGNIRRLVEKNNFLMSIVPGLINDEAGTVCMVLSTFKKHILENNTLSKTNKLYLFSTSTLKLLIQLYNWKGPRSKKPQEKTCVSTEEKEIVSSMLHEFLLLLCTSFKYGIVFNYKNINLGRKSHNPLLFSVLKDVEKPWKNEYASNLVVNIVHTCPDLVDLILSKTLTGLEDVEESKEVFDFLKNIFSYSSFDSIENVIKELSFTQLVIVTEKLFVPKVILSLFTSEIFKSSNKVMHPIYLNLLLVMLQSLYNFLNFIETKMLIGTSDISHLKKTLNDYLNKNLPSASHFVTVWTTHPKNDVNLTILDLFIYYHKLCPRLLNDCIPDFTPMKVISGSKETSTLITSKAAELFLMLDPTVFTPDKDYFSKYFLVISKIPKEQGAEILKCILTNTGLFYASGAEIPIWVDAIYSYDIPIELLIESIQAAFTNSSDYVKHIEEVTKTETCYMNTGKNLDDLFDLIEQDDGIEHLQNIRQANPINPSPLVLAVSKLSNSVEWKKFRPVIVSLIFTQTEPNILLKILSKPKKSVLRPKHIFSYMEIDDKKFPILIDNEKLPDKIINFTTALLNSDENNVIQILSDIKITHDHFKATIFYFNQLISSRLLSQEYKSKFKSALILILNSFKNNPTKYLMENLMLFYDHPQIRHMFLPFARKSQNVESLVTKFVIEISKHLMDNFDLDFKEFLFPYRLKFVKRISVLLKKLDKCIVSDNELTDLFRMFKLQYNECLKVIVSISKIPPSDFVSKENTLSCVPVILSHVLLNLIENYKNGDLFDNDVVIKLIECYIYLIKNPICLNMEILDSAFLQFFMKFPHFIENVKNSIFEAILQNPAATKTKSELAGFLLNRDKSLSKLVNEHFDSVLPNRDLVFALYKEINDLDDSLHVKIFEQYKHVIIKNFEKPQKISTFFRENCVSIIRLLDKCAPVTEFTHITHKIHKFEAVDKNHIDALESVFMKDQNETTASNYIVILLHMSMNVLNRDNLDYNLVIYISKKLESFIKKISGNKFSFGKVQSNSVWKNFIKATLKYGLKHDQLQEECNKFLLDTLTLLCQNLYLDNTDIEDIKKEIALIHEMTFSHSEFLNVILGNMKTKLSLAKFLLVLSKKNPEVMSVYHIPLFLGAYSGTTSERPILVLLAYYETSSLSFHQYRPYLWGEHAISHYSVRGNIETALLRQPSTSQVLDLLNGNIILNTIYDPDVFVSLDVSTETEVKGKSSENHFNHIIVDKVKQSKLSKLSVDFKLLKYDPAFYLPLFSHLLAPESVVQHYKFSQSGALALTLSFFSNENKTVRAAATHVISRFYFHLEGDKTGSNEKKLWIRFIDALRKAIVEHGDHVPTIWAVFLSRAAIVLTQPMHPLYTPISYFLLAKESFDFSNVPELLQLFHSSEVDYKQHRIWILEVIRDGMKTELDNKIMLYSVAYKYILDFYSRVLANKDDKLLILQIIKCAIVINKAQKILVFGFGLVSWLIDIIDNIKEYENESISLVVHIVSSIWTSLTRLSKAKKTALVRDIKNAKLNIIHLITKLSKLLSLEIYLSNYLVYIKIVYEVILEYSKYFSRDNLLNILKHGTELLGENDCEYILKYGYKYIEKPKIPSVPTDDVRGTCLFYLKSSVIHWMETNSN